MIDCWGYPPPFVLSNFPLTENSSSFEHSEQGSKELSPQAATFADVLDLFTWIIQSVVGVASSQVQRGKSRMDSWYGNLAAVQESRRSLCEMAVLGNKSSCDHSLSWNTRLRHNFVIFEQLSRQILT